jgi:MFS family permease
MGRLVFLSSAIVICDTMLFAALTPLLPEYAADFGLSKGGAGVLQAAYPMGTLVGSIPSGYIAARFGAKPTAIAALLLIAGTSLLFGLAGSVLALDTARFIQGIGSACAWTSAFTWLVAEAPAERRGQLIGSVLGLAIAGALFGPVLGGLGSVIGTGPVFGAVGLVSLTVAALAFATPAPPPGERQPIAELWRAVRDRRLLGGFWLVALPGLLFGTLTVLVPLRLSDLGVSAVGIGGVFLITVSLEAFISPLMGRVTDRRGTRHAVTIALAASTATSALLPWPQRGAVLVIATVFAASAFGMFWTPAMSLLTSSAERLGLKVAWVFALSTLAWAPGQGTGAAAGGALAGATSDAVPYLLLSAACGATLVLVRRSSPD